MSGGDRFVQTLQKLNYPKGAQLDGEDFDWLFEAVDLKPFLDWFCSAASEQNVVPDEKLQAFNTLKESGKPVLDEKALDEVLKTFSISKVPAIEEVAIEKLEEEVKALQKQKNLHIRRRNKLQMVESGNRQMCLKSKDKEEETGRAFQEVLHLLRVTNKKLNHELQSIVNGVQTLMSFFSTPETACELSSQPIFLSQLLRDKYLSLEEQSTAALTSFTKEHFFEGMSKFVEGSDENFQLVQLNVNSFGEDGTTEDKCKEMMRLQLAYICAKHKLIQMKAKSASLKVGLQWAENNASVVQDKASQKEENLKVRITSLKNETLQIENHTNSISNEKLPGLVRDNAQLLNMPIVKGDYDLQMAHQTSCSSRQDLVCDHLMKQKASFELLQLGYELELRKHRDVYRELGSIVQELKESGDKLEERLTMLSDVNLLSASKPRSNIDSKDLTSHRLYQLLDGDNTQKLFRTYDGLESVAQKLSQDIASMRDQLEVSEQEHSLLLSKLDSHLKELRDFMYPEGNTLMLTTPELSGEFHQLGSQLEKLNHITVEILGDLQLKRKMLESNKLQQIEKQLYVYFFQNEEQLKSIVGKLEAQTGGGSSA
ncbi:hypothetical protein XELAEV_18005042mg [Xenopus laevis]|uniref:HAUS augmin-like complex subunit 3 N-terminal domain-containing protein n=1 Tax=Xenopus laevis TaxID=8355 RepID=A0A974DXB1_XENLA|nr:hypothetical protein XELAEV_18005042mg [Xenopus laevis]